MPSAAAVARSIRLWRDSSLGPEALSANLARFAREARDDLIARGDAAPSYTTIVDGRAGAVEESVRPEGAIVYRFSALGLAASFALTFCIARSPVRSGRYADAWFIAVNGHRWDGELASIPPGSEVIVTNPEPYARKIDAGHMRMRVPPGIIEDAKQAVGRKYPSVIAKRQMVTIPQALGGGYILAGRFRRGHRQFARTKLRSDTVRGAQMTYPALVMSER